MTQVIQIGTDQFLVDRVHHGKKAPTDTDRLDFLQALTDRKHYTGKVVLRESVTGRGWRLHESSQEEAVSSVRDAIDDMMEGK